MLKSALFKSPPKDIAPNPTANTQPATVNTPTATTNQQAKSTTNIPTQHQEASHLGYSKYIVEMQKEMIDIGHQISEIDVFNKDSFNIDKNKILTPIFNSNIVNSDDFKTTSKQEPIDKPWSVVNRLNSLLNIGTKDKIGYAKPDGVWGNNTNKGLLALIDIFNSFISVGEKLNMIDPKSFISQEVNKIKSLIPEDLKDQVKVNEAAYEITTLLKIISDKIKSFTGQLNNDNFVKNLFNDKNGFDVGYGKKEEIATKNIPNFNSAFLGHIKQDTSGKGNNSNQLSFSSLSDLNSLIKYMEDNKITINGVNPLQDKENPNLNLIGKFIDYLVNGINNNQVSILSTDAGY